ncbi:peptidase C48, SUMO/sentrin/Ubl1 [Tanacetum coccineum]
MSWIGRRIQMQFQIGKAEIQDKINENLIKLENDERLIQIKEMMMEIFKDPYIPEYKSSSESECDDDKMIIPQYGDENDKIMELTPIIVEEGCTSDSKSKLNKEERTTCTTTTTLDEENDGKRLEAQRMKNEDYKRKEKEKGTKIQISKQDDRPILTTYRVQGILEDKTKEIEKEIDAQYDWFHEMLSTQMQNDVEKNANGGRRIAEACKQNKQVAAKKAAKNKKRKKLKRKPLKRSKLKCRKLQQRKGKAAKNFIQQKAKEKEKKEAAENAKREKIETAKKNKQAAEKEKKEKAKKEVVEKKRAEMQKAVAKKNEEAETQAVADAKLKNKMQKGAEAKKQSRPKKKEKNKAEATAEKVKVLNYEERIIADGKDLRRRYFPTNAVLLNEEKDQVKEYESFENLIKNQMNAAGSKKKMKDVEFAFFPTVADDGQYYVIVFNFLKVTAVILDNQKDDDYIKYKEVFDLVKVLFLKYLQKHQHPCVEKLSNDKQAKVLKLKWKTEKNKIDNGLYTMMHMELYQGESATNWKTDIKFSKDNKDEEKVKKMVEDAINRKIAEKRKFKNFLLRLC